MGGDIQRLAWEAIWVRFSGLSLGETAATSGAMVLQRNVLAWHFVDGDLGSFGNFLVLGRRVGGGTLPGSGKNEPRMYGIDAEGNEQ